MTTRAETDRLADSIASTLLSVTSETFESSCQQVLQNLVRFVAADGAVLRRDVTVNGGPTDDVVVATWPPQPRTEPSSGRARGDAAAGNGVPQPTEPADPTAADHVVETPLLDGEFTIGCLGISTRAERTYSAEELHALRTVAALLARLTIRINAEEQLRYIAYHDDLTGLPNRLGVLDELRRRLADGQPDPVAILLVDVHRFKAMNDFLGHRAGDEFLRMMVERLSSQLRDDDYLARVSSDEFVVVPSAPMDEEIADLVARRVLDLVSRPTLIGSLTVSRGASIGVAWGTPGETTGLDLLGNARGAADQARADGGNGVVVAYTEEIRRAAGIRTDIELRLRSAIDDGSLTLLYQPEVDLRTSAVVGAEALVRWRHPTRGLLQPDSFIEIAESTNMAGQLGQWVLDAACAQLARWLEVDSYDGFTLRVNVSPAQLISIDFVDVVASTLDRHGVAGDRICLELTEHAVVSDVPGALASLGGLKQLGVQVAIDDFGTGYSSLGQLKAVPVDVVKIDRGFVRDLGVDGGDHAIVAAIVGLAKAFGLDLVAEGVQTPLAARTLVELGCFRAQGYLLGRPMTGKALGKLIQRGFVDADPVGSGARY